MNRKILMSLGAIVFVTALSLTATGAFFNDTETSSGNTFTAGAIDLGIDNTSYYNGVISPSTSWGLNFDLDTTCTWDPDGPQGENPPVNHPCLFFNFDDLKPGDFGEDTISIHVTNNESWLCADVTLRSNDDVTCTEPENDADAENGVCADVDVNPADGVGDNLNNADGDLAQQIRFLWWADDGDNVLEEDETPLLAGALGSLGVGNTATVALADDDQNIFSGSLVGPNGGLLTDSPEEIAYVGKAWCFGNIAPAPTAIDDSVGNSPADATNAGVTTGPATPEDGGYTCTGASGVNNSAQTDSVKLDVSFRAVQTRHNETFQCVPGTAPVVTTLTLAKTVLPALIHPDSAYTLMASSTNTMTLISGIEGAGTVTGASVTAGVYALSESSAFPNTLSVTWQCIGNATPVVDNGNGTATVTVAAGENVGCVITNTYNPS